MSKNEQESEPDLTIPREVAYAAVGGGAMIATSTLLANFVDFEPAFVGPVVVGGLGLVATAAATAVTNSFMRADERASAVSEVFGVLTAFGIGISATAWMTWAQVVESTGGIGQWLSAAGIAGVAAVAAMLMRMRLESVTEQVIEERRQAEEEERLGVWSKILKQAGHTRQITDEDGTKRTQLALEVVEEDEHEFGIVARVSSDDPAVFKKLFWDGADEAIGIAARKVLGESITTSSVTVERTRAPGHAVINILTRDIITETLTYDDPDQETAASITEPVRVGRYANADVARLHLFKRHMQVLGESQSGKSSLINTLVKKWVRCPDALVWMGGVWKFPRAVMPWLGGMSHGGGQRRPVLDWVAPNQQRVLEMLATAYEEASAREADPEFLKLEKPTAQYPQIEIVLDECQHTLQDEESRILCHDGRKRIAGELVDLLTSGATSSFVHVVFSTQSALFADMGVLGGRIKSNISVSIAFRSGRDDFLEKVITGIKGSMNRTHLIAPGAMLVQQGAVREASEAMSNHGAARLGKAELTATETIPAIAAACADLGGRMPRERAEAFTVGAIQGVSAYERRFHFGDGSIEEFHRAIAMGNSYRDTSYPKNNGGGSRQKQGVPAMAGQQGKPQKITKENAHEFGLDPNMSMEQAMKNVERASANRRMSQLTDDQVDEQFAALAGLAAPDDAEPAEQPLVPPTGGDGANSDSGPHVPEIVNRLIDLFPAEQYKTFTGHEAAIALGMISADEEDDEKIRDARDAVGNEIFQATGLRTYQHRDPRHLGPRRRCFRVIDLEQARQDILDGKRAS